ncbi:MAG: GTP-binding protein [Candidatus Aenigmarchaeota archaeon]|nr:GTP-binding protein [Candidatus Aenigmarchaeota archaeon]
MAIENEIKELEEEITSTPYNKATQKHIGMLKAKLAKLKELQQSGAGSKKGKAGVVFSVKKQGDATVLLVGMPSVGKSTLINAITNAESKTAAYDFTTLDVIPGMLEHNGARIQVLDIPGIIEGASRGKGAGKKVLSAARQADMVLLMVDVTKDIAWQLGLIRKELYEAGFRIDQRLPEIRLMKKTTGGLAVSFTRKSRLDAKTVESVLKEFRILNADVIIREDITADQLVDFLMANRVYVPSLVVVNKMDAVSARLEPGWIAISAKDKKNLGMLKEAIWSKLGLARIYLKKIGQEPDLKEPLIMRIGCTVLDVASRLHKEMAKEFAFARVWGRSASFAGQKKGIDHKLLDRDIVELHKR